MNQEERININANLVDVPKFSALENPDGTVKVANFTLVKKYGSGKEYTNSAVYGEKADIAKSFQKGDLIHVFGYVKERRKNDKVYKNFVVLSLNKIEKKDEEE